MTLPTPKSQSGKIYRSDGWLALRFGVDARTIRRWRTDPKVGFPEPDLVINRRKYTSDETVDDYEAKMRQRLRQQVVRAGKAESAPAA